jgi:hypothetical protein
MELVILILVLVALNGVVSFAISAFVRSMIFAVIASTVITEMLVAIYFLNQAKHSSDAADVILGTNIVAILSTPVIICTSCGFMYCWRKWQHKHSA